MFDENYIKPEEIRDWFKRKPNEPYRKLTTLEYFFERGFLRFGNNTADDRLLAGKTLYSDFYLSGLPQIKALDLEKPKVDGGKSFVLSDVQAFHLDRFNKAVNSIGSLVDKEVLSLVVIEDCDVRRKGSNRDWRVRKYNYFIKVSLCQALDDLIKFYAPHGRKKHRIVGYSDYDMWR